MRILALATALGVCCCLQLSQAADPAAAPSAIDFSRDIKPILSNHCYACHGPDENQRKGSLRLDQPAGAFKRKKNGDAVVLPGQPHRSLLAERIRETDEARIMPPPEFGKPLKPEQVELLSQWIAEGAEWREHWSYVNPRRPPLPVVRGFEWPKNAVDYFILERLEREGLEPSPEADKLTLLRRVTLDLTGLPPTLAEQQAFLKDDAPGAYERVVDRLLASPRFGERWAVHWLDLARYADTNGYHIDNHREMWLWRDWVIQALNANLPFDQFTREQLAGDLLPNATTPQQVASGFHRNVMVNFEGGADPAEYLTKYIVDRVNTTATVWLGSTMACAECHDHKYDPFTQKDFYSLYAFFHNVPEQGLDGQKDNPKPSMKVPSPEQARRRAELAAAMKAAEAKLAAALARFPVPAEQPEHRPERTEFVWVDDEPPAGAVANGDGDGWKWATASLQPVHSGRRASVRTAVGRSQHYFENAPAPLRIGAGDQLFAHVWLDPKDPPQEIMLQWNDGAWEHRAYWGENKIDWGADKTPARLHAGPLPPTGRWVRLSVPAAAVGLPAGSLVNGMAFTQFGGTVSWDRAGVLSAFPQGETPFAGYFDWLRWEKQNKRSLLPAPLQAAAKKPAEKRTPAEKLDLWRWWLSRHDAAAKPTVAPLAAEQENLAKQAAELEGAIPSTMVMSEMDKPRETHILVRGDFQQKGQKVEPNVPAFLPPLPKGTKPDRLALADWLFSPEHPLTSRVTVNRWWEQLFGTGLVRSTEEFGSQGEWPTHPELLDWLAVEFRTPSPAPLGSGAPRAWNIKAMIRLMATSATYRQSARVTPELLAHDPQNRLLGRGPRFRLNAEFLRDQALAVSGLLDPRIGGPSVKPYQPPGLWEAVAFGGGFSAQTYEQSKGADLYRRGLYVYGKRSLPHPSLAVFDAPNRELCCDRRPRTNTPLQALTLLNDPIYVEAARKLGERIMKEGGADASSRLEFAFRLCLVRPPTAQERGRLLALHQKMLERYRHAPASAALLLSVGESSRDPSLDAAELAAWTALSNVLLNLDEMVTRG